MNRILSSITICLISFSLFGQAKVDLDRSIPIWFEYDESTNEGILKWIDDENASNYFVSSTNMFQTLTPLATLDGSTNEYGLGQVNPGELYQYHLLLILSRLLFSTSPQIDWKRGSLC